MPSNVVELRRGETGNQPVVPRETESLVEFLEAAIARTREYAFGIQHAEGYWQAPLEANATMDAQYVFFNRFMGRTRPDAERRILERLRDTQTAEGYWTLYAGGDGHLNATVEAVAALRMLGVDPEDPDLVKARDFILGKGGLERAGVFTKIFLAYFGEVPWSAIPTLPVELMLVPPWTGISIYEFSSWARETIVPLLVLMAKKPFVQPPEGFSVQDLYRDPAVKGKLQFFKPYDTFSIEAFFMAADRILKVWERIPGNPLRPLAMRRACEWIVEHQDANGGWGGIQPPMVNCPMALKVAGYPEEHPGIAEGIQAVDDFLMELPDGNLIQQPCVSPVWDTALMLKGLLDAGVSPDDSRVVQAADWIVGKQILRKGDWSVKNPDLDPGGWAFEFENDWYPDVDDTAVILMTLTRVDSSGAERERKDEALRRGLRWVLGMQSRNGGYAAFDTDNTLELLNRIPFADMEAMIDPPTADITGRILELMGAFGFDSSDPRAARALEFLRREQEPNGSWYGRWGVNYVYGTWSVLAGLRAIGEDPDSPWIRRAVAWLKSVQHENGSFGEDCRSYGDPALAGRGEATASQTAWGVLGLLAGENGISREAQRGVEWLLETQTPYGSWVENPFTGTGFPNHFYLRYWMYRTYFPLMALGQFAERLHHVSGANGNGRSA